MLIDMNDLPTILREQIGVLRGLVQSALRDFIDHHKELRVRYTARTEASIIHDYMVWHAKTTAYPWKIKRNLFLFRLGNDYSVKPKRLDRYLRPRYLPTQLALRFDGQRPIRLFDDLDLTHLYLGYQQNGAELVTSAIWLVCPEFGGIKWAAELRAEDAAAPVEIGVPSEPTIPTQPERGRVKPKKIAKPTKAEATKAGE